MCMYMPMHDMCICVCMYVCVWAQVHICVCICRYPYMCKSVCISHRTISDVIFQKLSNLFSEIACLTVLEFFNSASLVCQQAWESPRVHLSRSEINSMNRCTELGSSWLYGKDFAKWATAQPVNLFTFMILSGNSHKYQSEGTLNCSQILLTGTG